MRIVDPGAEEVLTGTTVFVFNAPRYALGLPFAPAARDDDGWLDVIVFRKPGPFQALYYLWKVFRGLIWTDPGVFHRRVKKVVVTSLSIVYRCRSTATPVATCPPRTAADPAAGWTVRGHSGCSRVIAPASRRRVRPELRSPATVSRDKIRPSVPIRRVVDSASSFVGSLLIAAWNLRFQRISDERKEATCPPQPGHDRPCTDR